MQNVLILSHVSNISWRTSGTRSLLRGSQDAHLGVEAEAAAGKEVTAGKEVAVQEQTSPEPARKGKM